MMRTKIVPKLTVKISTKRIAKGWSDLLWYLLSFSCLNPSANYCLNLALSERELGTRIPQHTKTFELLYLYKMLWDKRLYKKSTETCFYGAGRWFLFSSFSAAAGLENRKICTLLVRLQNFKCPFECLFSKAYYHHDNDGSMTSWTSWQPHATSKHHGLFSVLEEHLDSRVITKQNCAFKNWGWR